MSKDRYQVKVPTVDTWRDMVKCQAACPVLTDSRAYVLAVASGDLERGYRIAREPNPLSSMCGRICGAPCETACRRGDINEDEPEAMRPLKRILTERFGPEAQSRLPSERSERKLDHIESTDELGESPVGWSRNMLKKLAATPGRKTGSVAVIGAGPAGLSAAHDLRLLGYEATIYEAGEQSGGMIRYGVPSYRVDWEMMDQEVQEIVDLGVEIKYNSRIGKDITLEDLRKKHDAVFLSVGLMNGRDLNIEGRENDGVIIAVDLLLNYNLGYKVDLGEKVIVVGGGDVAMDAARTALRAGHEETTLSEAAAKHSADDEAEAVYEALDVARTALRLGARDVKIMALEDWHELPATQIEVDEALEEGIALYPSTGPSRIMGKDGNVVGFETKDVASVFDKDGRFNPQYVENSEKMWPCDTIILAIGQQADLSLIEGTTDIEITPRGLFKTDKDTGQTTAPDVFAGGDVAHGPRLLIDAIRDGHVASLAIDEYIQSKKIERTVDTNWTNLEDHVMPENWLKYQREKIPTLDVDRRTGMTQVELGYSPEQGAIQGMRCLECSVNTIFDGSLCILCNGCVDVCPWDCLKIVSLDKIAGDETLHTVIEAHTGIPLAEINEGDEITSQMAVMLKDDEACTRCALCADRCPTDAITMESFRFKETLGYLG
ncbi:MAG: FAD-dependent oxidoreductase [Anaerolineae bacterium]|nr:FAD-dependent oxidoreductase [Anaerolineae bacterium]